MPRVFSDRARRAALRRVGARSAPLVALAAMLAPAGALLAVPPGATALAAAPRAPATQGAGLGPRSTAVQQIRADWVRFFSPTTPTRLKIELLQNGARFAGILRATSTSVLARSTYAHVLAVRLESPTLAAVQYSISLAGRVAVSRATGTAIYSARRWKVGELSYCSLLRLELIKASACPEGE